MMNCVLFCVFCVFVLMIVSGCVNEEFELNMGIDELIVENVMDYLEVGVFEVCGGKCDDLDVVFFLLFYCIVEMFGM